MKVSFTQTYSDDRKELITYQMQDENLVEFKNMFDINLYSFHNCSDDVVDHFWKVNKLENVQILRYQDLTYTETIRETLKYLDGKLPDIFFFCQDDTFSIHKSDYEALLDDFNQGYYISLGYGLDDLMDDPRGFRPNSKVYQYTSFDFKDSGFWPHDDSPYLTSYDVVKEMYDEEYLCQGDIWRAEPYLSKKYLHEEFEKWVPEKKLFMNLNIIGPHSDFSDIKGLCSGEKAKEILKNKGICI